VCNDGITIAKEIELEDPEANLGAQMIREAAERTGEAVGDGTSTSAILAHAIFAGGLHNIAAGASAVDLKKGLDRGLVAAVKALKNLSRPVASRAGTRAFDAIVPISHLVRSGTAWQDSCQGLAASGRACKPSCFLRLS
jgi:chaperonin GroEL (HSP60 family)